MAESYSLGVKGGVLLSRLAFVREQRGEDGVARVINRLPKGERDLCSTILVSSWYPFEVSEHIDEAIAAEMQMGEKVFLLMGEKSAEQNLKGSHRLMLSPGDPHGLLRRAPQIYQMYYDHGRRTYERLGDKKAVLQTYDAPRFSRHDCLTIVGWHKKAIEMCGGTNVRVTETKCRTSGAECCEYVCEWD